MIQIFKPTDASWVKDKPGPKARYPFNDLEVGQSFVIPKDLQTCTLKSLRVLAHSRGKRLDRKFHVREREDNSFEVYRSK